MSYQEKRTFASIFSGILILAAYCIYAFSPSRLAALPPGDLKPWASVMLIFIAIGIVATIVIQIVFHILLSIALAVQAKIENQQSDDKEIERTIHREMIEDERDKQIELKSMRIGFAVAGIGFVSGLLSLVFNYSPVVMLNIMYLSFFVGSLLEGVGQLYYYRKGA
jgi:Na+/melibiose symporter-like transporter